MIQLVALTTDAASKQSHTAVANGGQSHHDKIPRKWEISAHLSPPNWICRISNLQGFNNCVIYIGKGGFCVLECCHTIVQQH